MLKSKLETSLADYFANWLQGLNLAVEATTADSVTLRLPQNDQLARPGGMLCGQAMMSAAAPSPTRCAKWVSSGRFR